MTLSLGIKAQFLALSKGDVLVRKARTFELPSSNKFDIRFKSKVLNHNSYK